MPIVTSSFTPKGVTQGGIKVTLAGVDITDYIDEASIDIKDTLGQGAGSGSGASPRASTFSLNSSLGPAATAVGSGSHITTPQLVRNGELIIYDTNNTRIFGGFLTKITDQTDKTQPYTLLEGVDYWQTFSRTIVNEIYSGMTDVQIITALMSKYAPAYNLKTLPVSGSMFFSLKNYRNKTLLDCLQDIIDSTGYQAWIDPYKNFHYVSPGNASTAPFKLSNSPDFVTSFQVGVDSYEIDDNAIINRVYFYGGRKPSNDFVQDLSTQANGNNTTFVLAYYPRSASDGKVHVYINGVEQAVGFISGTTAADQFKSQGGLADVLLNADAHTLTFDTAPSGSATVTCKYRYELPLMVVLSDPNSVKYYGEYLDGTLSDETVVDVQVAVQRSKVLLLEQSYGLKTLKLRCWRSGLQSGMVLRVDHSIRGIHDSFIVQEVDIVPKGNGFFEYQVTCGAWNWSFVDILNHLIASAQPADDSSQEETIPIDDQEENENFHIGFSAVTIPTNHGGYYARATALGDGHDAYCGFCSLSTGPSNDFSLSSSPSTLSILRGSNSTTSISATITSGSAETVTLSATSSPSGPTFSFAPSSVTSGGSSSTLTVTVPLGTSAGSYTITVSGTDGTNTHTTTIALTVTATYDISVLVDTPIRYYPQGETSGTVANDKGSQAQNGTIQGGVTLNQTSLLFGSPNASMLFNGSTGDISIPTTGLPTGANPWTVEFWFNTPSPTTFHPLFVMGATTIAANGVQFTTHASTGAMNVGNTTTALVTGAAITANTTYYAAITYNGSTITLYLYQGGSLLGTYTATFTYNLLYTSGLSYIGRDWFSDFYSGKLSNLAVYNYTLSSSRIQAHYNMGTLGHE